MSKIVIISTSVIIVLMLFTIKYNKVSLLNYMFLYSALFVANPIFKKSSLIGNNPFYPDTILPEALYLTKNWKIFRDEAVNSYKTFSTIRGDMFFGNDIIKNDHEWKKLYIKWHSDINSTAKEKCPNSCRLIESLPNVKIAMFSVLAPGAKILPHKGPYKGCLRYHLGLATPNSNECFISVNNIKYSWRDGKGILLDDTFEHWVHNNTNKTRIILFCDIVRPMNVVGSSINNFLIKNY